MSQIHMEVETLFDLLNRKTGNPTAESEIPQLLKDAINLGGEVVVSSGNAKFSVGLNEKEEFVFSRIE